MFKFWFGAFVICGMFFILPQVFTSSLFSETYATNHLPSCVGTWNTPGAYECLIPNNTTGFEVSAYGAQGGHSTSNGGLGGATHTIITNLTPGKTLWLYVGGRSANNADNNVPDPGGFNGGGNGGLGGAIPGGMRSSWKGSGGGGASDIRYDTNNNNAIDISERVVVAGGGGGRGGGETNAGGGAGGGLNGGNGTNGNNIGSHNGGNGGGGGTQTSGGSLSGSFGNGGNGNDGDPRPAGCGAPGGGGAGAGGGWYGGGGGDGGDARDECGSGITGGGGGGGGSNYVNPAYTTDTTNEQGVRAGNGSIRIGAIPPPVVSITPSGAWHGGNFTVAYSITNATTCTIATRDSNDAGYPAWTTRGTVQCAGTSTTISAPAWCNETGTNACEVQITTQNNGGITTAAAPFSLDLESPAISITSPADGSTVSENFTVHFTATDQYSGINTCSLETKNGQAGWVNRGTGSCSSRFIDAVSWCTTGGMGQCKIKIQAVDNVGNPNESQVSYNRVFPVAPTVTSFNVNSIDHTGGEVLTGSSASFGWTITDNSFAGINRVELWRATDSGGGPGSWSLVKNVSPGDTDAPGDGTYWYGIHIIDNNGNCITEAGGHCGGISSDNLDNRSPRGPIQVSFDTTLPVVEITSPAPSSWQTGDFTVGYNATHIALDTCWIETSNDGGVIWTEQARGSELCGDSQSFAVDISTMCNTIGENTCGVRVWAQQNPLGILDGTPAAHWAFNEGSGTTAFNSVGPNNGTLFHGPTWVPGKFGSALYFDGIDDYVQIPFDASIQPTDEVTISAWIKPDFIDFPPPDGRDWGILSKGPAISTVDETYSLTLSGGSARFRPCYEFTTSCAEQLGGNITPGVWTHIVGVYKRNDYSNVYVGGIDSGIYSSGGSLENEPLAQAGHGITIGGAGNHLYHTYFQGAIDDIKIWTKAFNIIPISDTRFFSIDVDPPVVTITDPTAGTWFHNDFTVDYTIQGEAERCTLSTSTVGGPWVEQTNISCDSTSETIDISEWCPIGTVETANNCGVKIYAEDIAGNVHEATRLFSLDITAPVVSDFTVSGGRVENMPIFTTAPLINWIVSDSNGSAVKEVEVWRTNDVSGSPNNSAWSLVADNIPAAGSFTDALIPDGTYWYGIHVIDNAGNCIDEQGLHACGGVSSDSLDFRDSKGPIRVIKDTQPPIVEITGPSFEDWYENNFVVTYTATDANIQTCTFEHSSNGGAAWSTPVSANCGGTNLTQVLDVSSWCPVSGQDICGVRITATDIAGNTQSDDQLFNINHEPIVNAGPDQNDIPLGTTASLSATVTDDGFPIPPGDTTAEWQLVTGPAPVTFSNSTALNTTASFTASGIYTLRLQVYDGSATTADLLQITIKNDAPIVDAGLSSLNLPFGFPLELRGTASDDNLPAPPSLTTKWIREIGPGNVTYSSGDTSLITGVVLDQAGTHTFWLEAFDGEKTSRDRIVIEYGAPERFGLIPCGIIIDNPDTPYNETADCEFRHAFLLLHNVVTFALWKMVPLLIALMVVLTGAIMYFQLGDVNTLVLVKRIWRHVGIGVLILLFSWLLLNFLLGIFEFNITIFGKWYELELQ